METTRMNPTCQSRLNIIIVKMFLRCTTGFRHGVTGQLHVRKEFDMRLKPIMKIIMICMILLLSVSKHVKIESNGLKRQQHFKSMAFWECMIKWPFRTRVYSDTLELTAMTTITRSCILTHRTASSFRVKQQKIQVKTIFSHIIVKTTCSTVSNNSVRSSMSDVTMGRYKSFAIKILIWKLVLRWQSLWLMSAHY